MIAENETIVFRKLLGTSPITQIVEWMDRQDPPLKNQSGNSYSISWVTRVFKGQVANAKVEKAIWDCVKEEMAKQVELKNKRENLLNELKNFTKDEQE